MKALTWHGKGDIRCNQVADPAIEDDRDIIKVTSCATRGSDLHLMDGHMPTMQSGDASSPTVPAWKTGLISTRLSPTNRTAASKR